MRLAPLAAVVLFVPALAAAQEGGRPAPAPLPPPTGSLLLESLPPGADLVVHTPHLQRFLSSAADAGLGTPAAWREALRGQLTRWSRGRSDTARLVQGAESLLEMADGEAVVASIELPRVGATPRVRSILVGFRSSRRAADLRAAVDDVVEAGLRLRWPGDVRTETTGGRPVVSISAPHDGLWLRVQDGLVLVSDHPLTLGLVFRGMERVVKAGGATPDQPAQRLEVRWGHGDARWVGFWFLGRESVAAPVPRGASRAADAPAALPAVWSSTTRRAADDAPLFAALSAARDTPVFPVPLPAATLDEARALGDGPVVVTLRGDATYAAQAAAETGAPTGDPVGGGAPHLAWLRALADGRLAGPVPALDAEFFARPLAAAASDPKRAPPGGVHPWRWAGADDPGQMYGPAWHGPVTMMLLRTLSDIAHGRAPGAPPPSAASLVPDAPPKPSGAPLPPPAPPKGR